MSLGIKMQSTTKRDSHMPSLLSNPLPSPFSYSSFSCFLNFSSFSISLAVPFMKVLSITFHNEWICHLERKNLRSFSEIKEWAISSEEGEKKSGLPYTGRDTLKSPISLRYIWGKYAFMSSFIQFKESKHSLNISPEQQLKGKKSWEIQ